MVSVWAPTIDTACGYPKTEYNIGNFAFRPRSLSEVLIFSGLATIHCEEMVKT